MMELWYNTVLHRTRCATFFLTIYRLLFNICVYYTYFVFIFIFIMRYHMTIRLIILIVINFYILGRPHLYSVDNIYLNIFIGSTSILYVFLTFSIHCYRTLFLL